MGAASASAQREAGPLASHVGLAGGCSKWAERVLNLGGLLPDLFYEVCPRDINLQRESHDVMLISQTLSSERGLMSVLGTNWVPQCKVPQTNYGSRCTETLQLI